MNLKSFFALSLGITTLNFSTPAFAGLPFNKPTKPEIDTPVNKPKPGTKPNPTTSTASCKVCVQWEKGQPGTFAGPCIRYVYQPCGTPPVIR